MYVGINGGNEMQQYCGGFKIKHNLTVTHPVSVVKRTPARH